MGFNVTHLDGLPRLRARDALRLAGCLGGAALGSAPADGAPGVAIHARGHAGGRSETARAVPRDGETLGEGCCAQHDHEGYLANPTPLPTLFATAGSTPRPRGVHPDGYIEVKDRSKRHHHSAGRTSPRSRSRIPLSPSQGEGAAVVARPGREVGRDAVRVRARQAGAHELTVDDVIAWCRTRSASGAARRLRELPRPRREIRSSCCRSRAFPLGLRVPDELYLWSSGSMSCLRRSFSDGLGSAFYCSSRAGGAIHESCTSWALGRDRRLVFTTTAIIVQPATGLWLSTARDSTGRARGSCGRSPSTPGGRVRLPVGGCSCACATWRAWRRRRTPHCGVV